MTFKSEFHGNERDRSGTATFKVGDVERVIPFSEFSDYHAMAQLLNEARRIGRQEAIREFSAHVAQYAREREWV